MSGGCPALLVSGGCLAVLVSGGCSVVVGGGGDCTWRASNVQIISIQEFQHRVSLNVLSSSEKAGIRSLALVALSNRYWWPDVGNSFLIFQ